MLDWSAATVPVLRADPAIDKRSEIYDAYIPKSELDERIWKRYDPDVYAGGPVSVQLIGRKMEEEKVLAGCGVLEDALRSIGVRYEEVFGESRR